MYIDALRDHYELCLKNGCSPRLAEMLAERKAPLARTNDEFMRGTCNGKQFEGDERRGEIYRKRAEAGGVSITGKKYIHGLARFPGDPEAWVSSDGEARRRAESRGWGVEDDCGSSTEPVQMLDSSESVALGEDIIQDRVGEIVAGERGGEAPKTVKEKADLRERVVSELKPHWK